MAMRLNDRVQYYAFKCFTLKRNKRLRCFYLHCFDREKENMCEHCIMLRWSLELFSMQNAACFAACRFYFQNQILRALCNAGVITCCSVSSRTSAEHIEIGIARILPMEQCLRFRGCLYSC